MKDRHDIKPSSHKPIADDLRGIGRLAINAVTGITDVVESMHRNIRGAAAPLGKSRTGPTGGITGLVYRSVRGVSQLVGHGIEGGLRLAAPVLGKHQSPPIRDAVVSALNGVFGDHLHQQHNPLALAMQWRRHGQPLELNAKALSTAISDIGPRPLLMIHGLCMNDRQWQREGHDHGEMLARELGFTPVYLLYNSGRHIAENGRELALLIQQLVDNWPVAIDSLSLVGHSMGGLLARSAAHYAEQDSLPWMNQLGKMVFLGTPHHGAPLERAGSWADALIGLSPYSAPLLRLGESRSAGIKDLRFGRLIDRQSAEIRHRDNRALSPLPLGVQCYAIAATKAKADPLVARWPSDGLVPVPSALGKHRDRVRALNIPENQRWIAHRCNHFDLLNRADVYGKMRSWLQP